MVVYKTLRRNENNSRIGPRADPIDAVYAHVGLYSPPLRPATASSMSAKSLSHKQRVVGKYITLDLLRSNNLDVFTGVDVL